MEVATSRVGTTSVSLEGSPFKFGLGFQPTYKDVVPAMPRGFQPNSRNMLLLLLLLCCRPGRDVASGSYRIVAVQMAFSKAARRLEALAQSHRSSSGTHINYLEGLFDVARALDRSGSKRGSWGPGAANTGLVDEYFVIGQGGRFSVSAERNLPVLVAVPRLQEGSRNSQDVFICLLLLSELCTTLPCRLSASGQPQIALMLTANRKD